MFKKTRLVVAAALVTALSTSAIAFAAGADTNEAFVDGSISPSKLDKKKYKPINLFTGVRTTVPGGVNGTQSNPVSEYLSYPKNVKFDLDAADICTTLPASGSTAQQARDACPKGSYLGSGVGEVQGPGIAPITDIVVSVFRGPGQERRSAAHRERNARAGGTDRSRRDRQVEGQRIRQRAVGGTRPGDGRADDHQVQREDHEGEQGCHGPLQVQVDDVPA